MSKIGNAPISLPNGVNFKINKNASKFHGHHVSVEGKLGVLTIDMQPGVDIEINNDIVVFKRVNELQLTKALHGMYRSVINSMIIGVSNGYRKELELQGIGYRAELNGDTLTMKLGYSHPVIVKAPIGIKFEVKDSTKISIIGFDNQLVGQTAAQIRSARAPEPYKGKGIRYQNEQIRRKAGKAAAK